MQTMSRNMLALFVCTLLACCTSSCAAKPEVRTESANQIGARQESAQKSEPAQTARAVSSGDWKMFRGNIGGTYKIQMRLQRAAETLEGFYFYENVRSDIALKGTIDAQGNFTLQERDASGAQTGTFKGKWKLGDDGKLVELSGDWSKPNAKRAAAFTLSEMPIAFSGALKLLSGEIKEENKKQRYSIEVEYPQLEGGGLGVEKFNGEARAFAAREVSEFKKAFLETEKDAAPPPSSTMGDYLSIDYTLGLANDDLISIEFYIETFSAGAAHPNHNTASINFDLKTAHTLKLADLFKPSTDYLRAISAYCIKDLKQQGQKGGEDSMLTADTIEEGASPKPENYKSWLVTKDGLEITFDPYQVAAYAAGPQTVLIPYAALREILKPDSPIASLAG